jgi:hypothetical protein
VTQSISAKLALIKCRCKPNTTWKFHLKSVHFGLDRLVLPHRNCRILRSFADLALPLPEKSGELRAAN